MLVCILSKPSIHNTLLARHRCRFWFYPGPSFTLPSTISLCCWSQRARDLCVHVSVFVHIAAEAALEREETDFQFVAHLKRDQSQYVMESCPPSSAMWGLDGLPAPSLGDKWKHKHPEIGGQYILDDFCILVVFFTLNFSHHPRLRLFGFKTISELPFSMQKKP